MEDITTKDWHEHQRSCLLLLLVLSKLSSDTRKISKMRSSNLPRPHQGAYKEQISEGAEEVELDKAWDLNAAEDKMLQQNARSKMVVPVLDESLDIDNSFLCSSTWICHTAPPGGLRSDWI
jgi:hypothetical protein